MTSAGRDHGYVGQLHLSAAQQQCEQKPSQVTLLRLRHLPANRFQHGLQNSGKKTTIHDDALVNHGVVLANLLHKWPRFMRKYQFQMQNRSV